MNRAVVFPALFIGNKELFCCLSSMPDYVLPLVEPGFVERTDYRKECIVTDFTNMQALLSQLADWSLSTGRTMTGIIGIDDEDQFSITRTIARHFNLPFYDDTTLSIASNKFLMKNQFVKHDVPTGNFVLLRDDTLPPNQEVGYPNVLKTITGSGSEYIFLNQDERELRDNSRYLRDILQQVKDDTRFGLIESRLFDTVRLFDTRREFLTEEYLDGCEYSCDFMIQNSRVQLLRVVRKLSGRHLGNFEGFYLMNRASLIAADVNVDALRDNCGRIASALGVSKGVQMVDFKVTSNGIRIIETSIRPGFSIFVALMQKIYGYTSLGIAARLAGGEPVNVEIPEDEGLAVYLRADRSGTVSRVDLTGLDPLRDKLNIIDVWMYGKAGDTVTDTRHDHFDLIQGYVLVKNPDRAHLDDVVNSVKRACVIEMMP